MKTKTVAIAAACTVALGLVAAHTVSAGEGHGQGMRGAGMHDEGMHGEGMRGEGHHGSMHVRYGHEQGRHGFGMGRHAYGDHHGHDGARGFGGRHFGMVFDLFDINADNAVSEDEARRPMQQSFARIDADKDGFATRDEIVAMGASGQGRFGEHMIDRLDADGDDRVSAAEFGVMGRMMFARADANDDGTVSFEEFAALRQGMHRGSGEGHGHRGPGPHGMVGGDRAGEGSGNNE